MTEPLTLALGDLRRLWDTFFPSPLGPLNPIWEHARRNAAPLDFDRFDLGQWLNYGFVPLVPLIIMAYLVVGGPKDELARGTREIRIALGVVGWSILTTAYLSNRFYDLRWCCYNSMFGIFYWQVTARYASLALVKEPIVDPYMGRGRPRWVAALDLVMNQRHLGLGNVGLDSGNGPPNREVKPLRPAEDGKPAELPYIARHNRHYRRRPRPTTRPGSAMRHLWKTARLYVMMDIVFALSRAVGPHAIAPPGGLPLIEKYGHVMDGWDAESLGILLPSTLRIPIHNFVLRVGMALVPPFMIWGFLSIWYHAVAFGCIASGLWEPDSWDVDVFDAPLRSTSLMELWGRRWHQLFRHSFVEATEATLRILHLPKNLLTFYPLIYFFSGFLHAAGEMTADPVPKFSHVMLFFASAGVGCSLEIAAKRIFGIRTRGLLGWIWTWGWIGVTGKLSANAWIDAGFSACSFFPDWGVGQLVAPYILQHVYMIYHLPPGATVPVISDAAQALLASPAVVQSLSQVAVMVATPTVVAVAAPTVVAMATATAAMNQTMKAVAVEHSTVLGAMTEAADTIAQQTAKIGSDAAENGTAGAAAAAADLLSDAETIAGSISAAVLQRASAAADAEMTTAAVESLSTVAEAEATQTVRFITVDSVPAHIVEAAIATANAAMSASVEQSTATS